MYFGFGALLNGPHDQFTYRCAFAACHGVPTSHALPRLSWGPSLRAIASLLQAKHMPPRSGLCKLSGRAARHAEQRGDGRAKAECLTVCVKNLFFPDTFPEERASFKRSAFSSFLRLHKKGKNRFSSRSSRSVARSSTSCMLRCKPKYMPPRHQWYDVKK